LVAVRFACAQLGRPYVWGGNGVGGFDCSGLTTAAYAAAGITIPRTADEQFRAGPRLAPHEPLQPGDLVFYGDPNTRITHVALYIGANQVVQARDVGTLIEQDTLPRAGYAGATRPAAQNAGPR
jgi:cell wall-associated NlpC family hydrolase